MVVVVVVVVKQYQYQVEVRSRGPAKAPDAPGGVGGGLCEQERERERDRERERGTKVRQGAGQAASLAPMWADEASEKVAVHVAFEVVVVRCAEGHCPRPRKKKPRAVLSAPGRPLSSAARQ